MHLTCSVVSKITLRVPEGAWMTSEPQVMGRVAAAHDLPIVAACLASAFYEDPLWGHWTFPHESRRRRDLLPFMTLMVQLGAAQGWTAMTASGESVAIWTPPGASYGSPEQEPLISEVLRRLFGARAPAIHELFRQFEAHTPAGRFYHLEWWATHRRHAGRGFGGMLLRENLARVDAEHLPSYLESTNPGNLPRYEALGFRRVGEFAPPGGPTVTTMWREAR
jgi:GNAT superfamily N-acetyltransferase